MIVHDCDVQVFVAMAMAAARHTCKVTCQVGDGQVCLEGVVQRVCGIDGLIMWLPASLVRDPEVGVIEGLPLHATASRNTSDSRPLQLHRQPQVVHFQPSPTLEMREARSAACETPGMHNSPPA